MGKKYEFKADSNPPPGAYEVDTAVMSTKTRTPAAQIKEKTSNYHKQVDNGPDHYRVHVPWVEARASGLNHNLTKVSGTVEYGSPSKTQTFSRKKLTSFVQSPTGSRMSESRYKPLSKAVVPKFNQTPKAKARGKWNKKEAANTRTGIETVTNGQTIQKLMSTESITRAPRTQQQQNTTKTSNTKTATVGGVSTTTYTTTTQVLRSS